MLQMLPLYLKLTQESKAIHSKQIEDSWTYGQRNRKAVAGKMVIP